jgi:flagellar biosynthetic protein FliQ
MAFDLRLFNKKLWSVAMTPEFVVEFAKEAILLTIYLSAPMLGLGLLAGLIISVFQAVTQIQEMTLTFVPKIIAVFMGLLFAAPWMLEKMTSFTTRVLVNIPMYIR